MAYITGWAGFHGHEFEVGPATLIPRPDTELLVDAVSRFIDTLPRATGTFLRPVNTLPLPVDALPQFTDTHPPSPVLLDIGTGSGCIPCSLALMHPKLKAVAIDISPDALAIARRNAERLGVSGRIAFRQADVLKADFQCLEPGVSGILTDGSDGLLKTTPFSPCLRTSDSDGLRQTSPLFPNLRTYDVIVSNPPYIPSADIDTLMPEVVEHEPRTALDGGPDGLLFYRRLLVLAGQFLREGGLLAVEIGYDQGDSVPALFREAGFSAQLLLDAGHLPRVVLGVLH